MFSQLFSFLLKSSPVIKKWVWKKIYQFLASKYQAKDWTFMNYGFQTLGDSKELVLEKKDEFNRYFIQLYDFVASATSLKNKHVLEVGSGRGGGCDYIKRYHEPAVMTGVDYSQNAVHFCADTFDTPNLYYKLGDAENLPFQKEHFDVVLNVESSHCYANMLQFLKEVSRVLRPGGYFSFVDFRSKEVFPELESHFLTSELILLEKTNISAQVLHALDEFNEAKMTRLSAMFGTWLKKPLSEFAGLKGSAMHSDLSNGSTLYYHFLLQKKG